MPSPEHDDGPRIGGGTPSGAAVRTIGIARPDEGRPQSPPNDAARQVAWTQLWDRLLAAPVDRAA